MAKWLQNDPKERTDLFARELGNMQDKAVHIFFKILDRPYKIWMISKMGPSYE